MVVLLFEISQATQTQTLQATLLSKEPKKWIGTYQKLF